MQQDNSNFIINEKIKFKKKLARRALCILFLLLLYGALAYFYIFYLENPPLDEDKQRDILLVFLPTLATIMISVFLISGSENLKEYPSFKRKGILIFVFWMVPNIILPLLFLVNILPLLTVGFKFSVVLFVSSLLILIPYVFMFIHSSISDVLRRLFNFSALPFIFEIKRIKEQTVEKTNEKVDAMGKLILRAINEYDDTAFSKGFEKIDLLAKMILASSKLQPGLLNELLKNIIINYRYIALECVKAKFEDYFRGTLSKIESLGKTLMESSNLQPKLLSDLLKNIIINYRYITSECIDVKSENYLRETLSSMTGLIKYGISSKNPPAAAINYPIAVDEMKKIGLKSIESDMNQMGSELIDNLAQIGDLSLRYPLDHPPAIEIVTAFQEIGSEFAKKGFENFCLEVLVKIEYFAREILNDMDSFAGSGRIEEAGKVIKSALKSHWIVSAYLFKNIPEANAWLRETKSRMEEEFKEDYREAYYLALKTLDLSSYVGKRILEEYRFAIRGKNLITSPGLQRSTPNNHE